MAAFNAIAVAATGTTVTSGAASASVAIPNAADGNRARFVRIQAAGLVHVKPGGSAVACTADDMMVSASESVILSVKPFTHIAYLEESAGAKLTITPVEF
jgi:hypothetical protein